MRHCIESLKALVLNHRSLMAMEHRGLKPVLQLPSAKVLKYAHHLRLEDSGAPTANTVQAIEDIG